MSKELNSKTWKVNFFGIALIASLMALFLASCSNKADDPVPTYPKKATVEYRITSTSGIVKTTSISYTNLTGGTTSLSDNAIPFSVKFDRTVKVNDVLSVSVLHNNSANGNQLFNLKLEILVDGKIVKTETFEGSGSVSGAIVYLFL